MQHVLIPRFNDFLKDSREWQRISRINFKEIIMQIVKSSLIMSTILLGSLITNTTMAARTIDLAHQPSSLLGSLQQGISIKEISRSQDFNHTLHVRIQEMYLGVPVYGADSILHVKNADKNMSLSQLTAKRLSADAFMNGHFYQNLASDLGAKPNNALEKKAIQKGIDSYVKKINVQPSIKENKAELIVYVDDAQKAHWAYLVSFYIDPIKEGALPAKPTYIIDANNQKIYVEWDNIQTTKGKAVDGGGFGGNLKMGKLVYDGLQGSLSKLSITRDDAKKTCSLENSDVVVKNYRSRDVITFSCEAQNPDHNNVYWDGDEDQVNGGYSPSNDALFGGQVIKNMYQDWYGVPVLVDSNGKPMLLKMIVHARMDNAYWDGRQMTFGDGISYFYPLTSLGVAAHEISHGFTQQHANLAYYSQSGGMNEAFSDMAAQAAEFYAYGKNSWEIGPEIFKSDRALRYMAQPSKDCEGSTPGDNCSIDDASQYYSGLDVHYSSGVYNRLFYLMGTSSGFDVRKAFNVMVKANEHYWTSSSNFATGACGVLKATADFGYDVNAVKKALDTVKVSYKNC